MQRRDRRFFSKEFKRETAGLILDQGYSVPEACKAMDVGRTAIGRWGQQLQDERNGVTPRTKALTPENISGFKNWKRRSKDWKERS